MQHSNVTLRWSKWRLTYGGHDNQRQRSERPGQGVLASVAVCTSNQQLRKGNCDKVQAALEVPMALGIRLLGKSGISLLVILVTTQLCCGDAASLSIATEEPIFSSLLLATSLDGRVTALDAASGTLLVSRLPIFSRVLSNYIVFQ